METSLLQLLHTGLLRIEQQLTHRSYSELNNSLYYLSQQNYWS